MNQYPINTISVPMEHFNLAQELSSTGSFSWLPSTDEVTFSQQTYRIFELQPSPTATIGQIAARIHPDDAPMVRKIIELARCDGNDLDIELRLKMSNSSIKYLHAVARSTQNQNGELEYIGAIQDVSRWRLSEEALAQARSHLEHVARITSLGLLTASIAHEVNQPLSGIITNAGTCLRMLAADPPNVDGALETVRRTLRDGNRASDIVAGLRSLFSNNTGSIEPFDLSAATEQVVALSLRELQRNGVILQSELAPDLPWVSGDRAQIQQVILNLLTNASEAMSDVAERPRLIHIKTDRDNDGHVRLTVRDTGTGIGHQDTRKLFEPFYTTKSTGMGIGLSVSQSIIESHHGRIWAESNDVHGSLFAFSIPCHPLQGL